MADEEGRRLSLVDAVFEAGPLGIVLDCVLSLDAVIEVVEGLGEDGVPPVFGTGALATAHNGSRFLRLAA